MSTFWNSPDGIKIKQKHKWFVTFGQDVLYNYQYDKLKVALPPHFIKSIDRPSYELGVLSLKHNYGHTINYPKRLAWKPINIVFYDLWADDIPLWFSFGQSCEQKQSNRPFPRSTQRVLYDFLAMFGYHNPSSSQATTYHFNKNITDAIVGKGNNIFHIHELDDDGNVSETWKLHNPVMIDFKTDKLDYSGTNVLTISCNIVYDWAELKTIEQKGEQKPKKKEPVPSVQDDTEDETDKRIKQIEEDQQALLEGMELDQKNRNTTSEQRKQEFDKLLEKQSILYGADVSATGQMVYTSLNSERPMPEPNNNAPEYEFYELRSDLLTTRNTSNLPIITNEQKTNTPPAVSNNPPAPEVNVESQTSENTQQIKGLKAEDYGFTGTAPPAGVIPSTTDTALGQSYIQLGKHKTTSEKPELSIQKETETKFKKSFEDLLSSPNLSVERYGEDYVLNTETEGMLIRSNSQQATNLQIFLSLSEQQKSSIRSGKIMFSNATNAKFSGDLESALVVQSTITGLETFYKDIDIMGRRGAIARKTINQAIRDLRPPNSGMYSVGLPLQDGNYQTSYLTKEARDLIYKRLLELQKKGKK